MKNLTIKEVENAIKKHFQNTSFRAASYDFYNTYWDPKGILHDWHQELTEMLLDKYPHMSLDSYATTTKFSFLINNGIFADRTSHIIFTINFKRKKTGKKTTWGTDIYELEDVSILCGGNVSDLNDINNYAMNMAADIYCEDCQKADDFLSELSRNGMTVEKLKEFSKKYYALEGEVKHIVDGD